MWPTFTKGIPHTIHILKVGHIVKRHPKNFNYFFS